jgi:ATP-dependent DNA ligase
VRILRVNRGQPLVIGGYTLGAKNFDAIVFGYYDGGKLMYAGRTRGGFTPASRDQLFKRFKALAAETCPFANLPEAKSGRWGVGLIAEKMKDCRWLKPMPVDTTSPCASSHAHASISATSISSRRSLR